MKGLNIKKTAWLAVALCLLGCVLVFQAAWADGKTTIIRVNRVFGGVKDDGGVSQFNFGSSWWTADYDNQGQSMENGDGITGSYVTMATSNWTDPAGKLIPKAVVRSIDVYTMSPSIVTKEMTNHVRWALPVYKINGTSAQISALGTVDPTKMVGTSDQVVTVTGKNALGVEIQRTLFAWSQNFHDNYIVCDLVLTNKSGHTLTDFYTSFHSGEISYVRRANGSNPSIPPADAVNVSISWQHYYGARPGDSLRVFYEYHGDDPNRTGDQMHGAMLAQDGRLYEYNVQFYTILHASKEPYTSATQDVDDPIQPRMTYCYSEFPMGVNQLWGGNDVSGRELLWDLMTGQKFIGQEIPDQTAGTHHRANSDEQGSPNWTILGEGYSDGSIWTKRISSFGPYPSFQNGQSIHIVYATGFSGIGIKKAKEVGEK
ncbi:MAG TPA: hypothetical protein VGB38_03360, partial [bacterium]